MYDTKYECRYYKDSVFLDTDDVSEDEKEFIRTYLYREDLLNIFCMDDSDETDIFNEVISELYNLIHESRDLMECMKIMAAKILSEDEGTGLCLLYSYDFMYLTHKCVSSYLDDGVIHEQDLNNLKDKLNL